MTEAQSADEMIPIAVIYSRSEAMVVAALLDARGIFCHIGGYHHASVEFFQVALGGFRLTVPRFQHAEASEIIRESPGFEQMQFSEALRSAIIRFLTLWMVLVGLSTFARFAVDPEMTYSDWAMIPISVLGIPVNPQGVREYFLTEKIPD